MEAPKVTLSEAEYQLLTNAGIILTKNSVINKISHMFGELGNCFYDSCATLRADHPNIFEPHPKVSKGEKHKDLPWIMLDYPRHFGREGHIAVRCFCWWGNYYSIQLQASGQYLHSSIKAYQSMPQSQGWHVGLTDDPWELTLPPIAWQDESQHVSPGSSLFFKMAKKIPISEWEQLENILTDHFKELRNLLEMALSSNTVK